MKSEVNCMNCMVSSFKDNLCEKEFCEKYKAIGSVDDFMELIGRKTGQWIPVSERLTEEGKAVLISDMFGVKYGWQYGGHWFTFVSYGRADVDPVAWMPLPEPYEDGGGK